MSELEHVARPMLPWRMDPLTECGKPPAAGRVIIGREEFLAKVKRLGKQRSSMSTCMTCWEAAQRNRDWNQSPAEVMAREVKGVAWWNEGDKASRLDEELRAIAALIEAHRAEFDGYLAGLADTASLSAARRERERRLVRRLSV